MPRAAVAGNLVGLAVSPLLLSRFGWRGIFYIFGVLGAPMLIAWLALVPPDKPRASNLQSTSAGADLTFQQPMIVRHAPDVMHAAGC